MNANARCGLHRRAHSRHSRAVSGHTRHVAPLRPAPVAVHDNSDVFREPLWIKMPVDFNLSAIQPGGNFGLQSDPLRIEASTAGKRVAMTRKAHWEGREGKSTGSGRARLKPCCPENTLLRFLRHDLQLKFFRMPQ